MSSNYTWYNSLELHPFYTLINFHLINANYNIIKELYPFYTLINFHLFNANYNIIYTFSTH